MKKFTQEVKDSWLEALKSGKYTQTEGSLKASGCHCCIGVLGEITEGLSCDEDIINEDNNPYKFLHNSIGEEQTDALWGRNDNTFDDDKPDYSNVIPMIEGLKIQG